MDNTVKKEIFESKTKQGGLDWAKIQEVENFADTVKLYRQGKIGKDIFRRFRLQHGAYGSRMTDDYSMIRIKAPAGQIYPHQLRKLAQLSEAFSIGSAHVSTRQSIQLHWVVLEDVSEVMRGLAEVGMTSREACGNSVRNVMCSPLSGVCTDEEFDATPYAFAVTKFFLRNPLSQNLPRKFKFNFTCCEKHGMARMVDVGLIPQTRKVNGDIQRGFKIFLGGGLGNKSFVGHQLEEFTPEEDLLYTSIAVVRIFDRLGNRKNLARNRMRYLVDEMGWDDFQNTILRERAVMRATQSVTVKLNFDKSPPEIKKTISISDESNTANPNGYSRWLKTNTIKQKQDRYFCVFINLEAGDITSNQLLSLADICQEFSAEGFARNSFSQGIVLRWINEEYLPKLYARLIDAGLAKSGSLTMASSVGCSGTTSCNLALTNSHRLAKEVQRKFLELKLDEDEDLSDSTIKISGCPNSCGQHEIATIGFYGGGGRVGKDMYPNYQMSLGGRSDSQTMLGINCMRVPAKRVIPVILKIIGLFKKNKKSGDTMSSWINRIVEEKENSEIKSVNDFKKILSPLIIPPSMEDDKDFYSDYGSDTRYHTVTGKGECAA
ncbi:nitrite/sulfite reductase [Nitrosopumilus sp.]|uniref:nitrite/sulfite reductase n=1 Tax=Nitrosopumilus sp. TaxID=2024843 RepID=UPI002930E841|nr:nitrite/sulfite reductase [Nitrosopumilus sp.]